MEDRKAQERFRLKRRREDEEKRMAEQEAVTNSKSADLTFWSQAAER